MDKCGAAKAHQPHHRGRQSHAERRLSETSSWRRRARPTLSAISLAGVCHFRWTVVVNSQDGTPQGSPCGGSSPERRLSVTLAFVPLPCPAVAQNASEAHLGLSLSPLLRRASSEPTTLPRSSVCQAGRSKNTAAPAPARSFASLAVASSMRSKTSKPGPPSAHATPRPIPDNSHPRAARFRRRAYAAVEGCHGCAARSTTSKSNSYTPSGPAISRRATLRT